MEIPEKVLDLVKTFANNSDYYLSNNYNETQGRQEFIDPLFEALGWDVRNLKAMPPSARDVRLEDTVEIQDGDEKKKKAPDYGFYVGGARKFFVEAKKPQVAVQTDVRPALQLRRYAWNAKLPLSIVTDFQEFAVYDTRKAIEKNDRAETHRILYVTYEEYAQRWSEIANLFSKEAVLAGSLERYAAENAPPRRSSTVDDAFLKTIEQWRQLLAYEIGNFDTSLSVTDLNFAVQMTIDRILFLRICEDRGIETFGQLQKIVESKRGDPYQELLKLFRKADKRYNSGLFHFEQETGRTSHPDKFTPSLTITQEPLGQIIRDVYEPHSPYEFGMIPVDVLGQVYERFLGKVVRLEAGTIAKQKRTVVIEEKPEVRKAGGVYYTPTYIVEYIVRQTLSPLLEGRTPETAAHLRVLDPACGSGSFLLGAYKFLMGWYQDWYIQHDPAQYPNAILERRKDDWQLTTAEKKRILRNNIFGVDLDAQAVEVAKLSLLLCLLEGENEATIQSHTVITHERALPDLDTNIR